MTPFSVDVFYGVTDDYTTECLVQKVDEEKKRGTIFPLFSFYHVYVY